MESKDQITHADHETQEHTSSEHRSHRHRSHHTESSGHSSGSSHKHSSSSHSKKQSHANKKSIWKKTKQWYDKKFGRKSYPMMILTAIMIVAFLLCCIFLADMLVKHFFGSPTEPAGNTQGQSHKPIYSDSSESQSIPDYWASMIAEKTETVKALQAEGGINCVSFVWASDTHIPDNHSARTDYLGVLMEKMLDDCDIPFAVLSGDIGTRASCTTEEDLLKAQNQIEDHLAPLWGTDRLLVALGNHDGVWGNNPNGDGATGYYRYQFSPERLWQFYFRWQALDSRRVFSDDGLYFYVDNVAQKTRFIILNSQYGGEYSQDMYGWAINDRFGTSCYGQEQLDWLAYVALDMPEGYSAIITTHVPPRAENGAATPYTVDCSQLNGIINAYCNRTSFSGSYTEGIDGWTNSTVNVDFTDAKGEIIALFAGHIHQDTVDTTTLACPIITILSAGAPVNFGAAPEREFETDTETSFDVVTINKETRTIYCTRIGAGKDREIHY